MRVSYIIVGVLTVLTLALPTQAQPRVTVAQSDFPEILNGAELPLDASALALSADGRLLAYAHPAEVKQQPWSTVVIRGDGEERRTRIPGHVRDLLFLPDSTDLVGIQHRPAKRREGESMLFAWRAGKAKIESIMRVPPSAGDLDLWPGGNAILLASRDEIRTILLPALQSGPLFSVPGSKLVVASMGAGDHVLVGSGQELSLLDLSVPSGRASMRPVAKLQLPAPVNAVAAYPSGEEALVLLDDARVFRIAFFPQRVEALAAADLIVAGTRSRNVPDFPRVAPAVAVQSSDVSAQLEAAATPVPPSPPSAEADVESVQPAVAPVAPIQTPDAAIELREPATSAPEPVSVPEVPSISTPAPAAQLSGRVLGATAVTVVLLGPNNILNEVARLDLDVQGNWHASGLAAGRYRVQLDAGGSRVLVTKPRFVIVEVGETPIVVESIEVLRSF